MRNNLTILLRLLEKVLFIDILVEVELIICGLSTYDIM